MWVTCRHEQLSKFQVPFLHVATLKRVIDVIKVGCRTLANCYGIGSPWRRLRTLRRRSYKLSGVVIIGVGGRRIAHVRVEYADGLASSYKFCAHYNVINNNLLLI